METVRLSRKHSYYTHRITQTVGVESSRSERKLECADIFQQSFFWLLRHTDEPQRGRNSCLWLQSRSVLSSFGVVLLSCRVNFHVVRSALQYSACRILYVRSRPFRLHENEIQFQGNHVLFGTLSPSLPLRRS